MDLKLFIIKNLCIEISIVETYYLIQKFGCWDADPKKRPSIKDIRLTFESKKIGPEFAEKRHLGAIYTSRPLSALISKCSSIYSFSTISIDSNDISKLENNTDVESLSSQNSNSAIQKFPTVLDSRYNSTELEFDINTESLSLYDLNSTIQNYSTALDSRYISAELDLDINTESFRSQNLSSAIQKFSTSLKKRRNEEILNVEPQDNSGKRIKTNFNYP
ncbi:unnamed protein product [Rhizophagus irregularis]|nr:unnamed protein product [Rhizophagus irregularis]